MNQTEVRQAAQSAVDQSKSFVSKQIDQRTTAVGEQIGSIADDLRRVGDQLRENGTASLATDYVDQGAEIIDRVGRYLQEADADQLIHDLEAFARRRPLMFASAAAVAGFAVSRFLKTSSARRFSASSAAATSSGTPRYAS